MFIIYLVGSNNVSSVLCSKAAVTCSCRAWRNITANIFRCRSSRLSPTRSQPGQNSDRLPKRSRPCRARPLSQVCWHGTWSMAQACNWDCLLPSLLLSARPWQLETPATSNLKFKFDGATVNQGYQALVVTLGAIMQHYIHSADQITDLCRMIPCGLKLQSGPVADPLETTASFWC